MAERRSTPAGKPLWRQAFDAVERPLGRRLEETVRTTGFSEALGLAARTRAELQRAVERRTRRLWHLVNLPAASDVARLRRQVAALDHEVRQLTMTVERERRAAAAGQDKERPDGSSAARGGPRAQRPGDSRPARRPPKRTPRA